LSEATFPSEGVEVTHILVVSNMDRSRNFYRDVLGAAVFREYGGTSCVLRFQGAWILLVTPGGPTDDKPDVTFEPPRDARSVSHSITMRVPDCRVAYEVLRSRGASFLTPPHDWGGEIRCFFRDPDGHLLEISEAVPSEEHG
jgi:catechol 2,3-dioxygenase-like lactoylglutathione lyase family enzyme